MNRGSFWLATLVAAVLGLSTGLSAQTPDLYYKFNETSGTAAANDGTVGPTNGTFNAAPNWLSPGRIGTGMVNIDPGANTQDPTPTMTTGYDPSANLTGDFTLEVWIRTTYGGTGEFFGPAMLTNFFHWFTTSTGEVSFVCDATGGTVQIFGSIPVNDGMWHHLGLSYDSTAQQLTMYVDGVEDTGVATGGSGAMPLVVQATDLDICNDVVASNFGFVDWRGDIDELRVWSELRSSTQIADDMNIELGQTTPEINVVDPNGDEVGAGGSHRIDPVAPGGTGTFDWTIQNVHPTVDLNLGTITVTATSGGTVNVTADPSNTTVAAGTSATLTVDVTGNAGPGTIVLDISIANDDADENPYDITVNGSRGLSGTLSVDNGGGGDYLDIGAAFDDLEAFGVTGALTIEVFDDGSGYASAPSYELGSDAGVPVEVLGTSSTNTITIKAASGQSPVINDGGVNFNIAGFVGGVGVAFTAVSHLTFEGFEYDGGGFGGGSDAGIVTWGEDGLYPSSNLTIRNNKIHNISVGLGILAVFNFGTGLDSLVIENNMLWDLGLTISTFSPNFTGAISVFRPTASCTVQHNTVFATTTFSPTQDGVCYQHFGGGTDLGEFNYNIFYNDIANAACVDIDDGGGAPLTPLAADRNLYYFPNGIMSTIQTSFANWQTQLSIDANSVNADPEFVSDTAPFDLHIPSSSPAVDLAQGSTVADDIDGDARPVGSDPDAGADENDGSGPPNNPAVTITASDPNAAESATASQNGEFTIDFNPAPSTNISVDFSLSGNADTGQSADYDLSVGAGGTLNWTGGSGSIDVSSSTTSLTVTLTPVDDAVVESVETATMTIDSGSGYTVGSPSSATISINDNDGAGSPVVTVSSSGSPAEAGTTTGTFTLNASPVPATSITVNFTLSGTASQGSDYNASATGTVTIDGSGFTTVTITPIDDTSVEGDENVVLTVDAGTGYSVGSPASASLTISDNDGLGGGSGSGGGGGGGGCTASGTSAPWLVLFGLLFAAVAASRLRTREE